MVLIVEGVNKTGKTTLCKLLKANGFVYYKDNAEHLDDLNQIERKVATKVSIISQAKLLAAISNEINLVVDRFHFTEAVYSFIERHYAIDYIEKVEQILRTGDIKLVYMTDFEDAINKRNDKDMSEYVKFMDDLFKASRIPYKVCIITDGCIDNITAEFVGLKCKEYELEMTNEKVVI